MVTTTERYFNITAAFAVTIMVSRILTPTEIGVWAVGVAITTTALAAREFTSSVFLIQKPDLSREDIRGAFTLMFLMSALIAMALTLLAPWFAGIYGEGKLVSYLRIAAIAIVLDVVALPLTALMRRDMAFVHLAVVNIASVALSAVVTVAFAALGFSYMSFAWAWVAAAIFSGMLAIYFRPDVWVFKPLLRRWRGMLAFGGYNGLNVLLYRLYEAIPIMVLGRVLSLDAVGLYNRALAVCQIPDKIVLGGAASVILPAMSVEVRAGRDLKVPYLRAVSLITALQWPALIVMAILAHVVVHILLGNQWLSVVPLVQIIAIASLFSFTAELNYAVLISVGAMKDLLLRALIAWPVSALMVAGASAFGLTAAALSFFVIIPFQAYVSLYFVRRHIQLEWRELGAASWRSAVIAGFSAVGPACIVALIGFRFDMSVPTAMLAGVLATIGWVAGMWLTHHPLLGEIKLAGDALRRFRDGVGKRA